MCIVPSECRLTLVRILHYSGAVDVGRSLNDRSILKMPPVMLRRFIVAALCGFATLAVPNVAQADSFKADLDGDGIHDRIEVTGGSRELAIRFSSTRRWQRLQTTDPIVRFVVADLDRDGDPDLVANTRQSGFQIWINKGRGLFSGRTHHLRPRRGRVAAHRPRSAVHGIQTLRLDDSLNDSNRLLFVWSEPARASLVVVGEPSTLGDARLTRISCRRRSSRGPPALLLS